MGDGMGSGISRYVNLQHFHAFTDSESLDHQLARYWLSLLTNLGHNHTPPQSHCNKYGTTIKPSSELFHFVIEAMH